MYGIESSSVDIVPQGRRDPRDRKSLRGTRRIPFIINIIIHLELADGTFVVAIENGGMGVKISLLGASHWHTKI